MKTRLCKWLALGAALGLVTLQAACGGDSPSNSPSCAQPDGSCPNICSGGTGVLGESCGSPQDCQCGLFCQAGQCMPYEGELAGCACQGGEIPAFPAPPAPVSACTTDTVGQPCEDDNPCTGQGTCSAEGACEAPPLGYEAACDDNNPCTTRDTCAGAVCLGVAREDGARCEDGDLCSGQDVCQAGACVTGMPPDCSGLDDACTAGACDPDTGACVPMPINEGGACDDGSLCTEGDACQGGACLGQARDCTELGDDCNPSACDPETGLCVTSQAEDGASCEDGDLCTLQDRCQEGRCQGGAPVTCDDPCVAGVCDPDTGLCGGPALEDGLACDDGDDCTLVDTCLAGVCTGQQDTCTCAGAPDGTACDDFDPCTSNDRCLSGECAQSEQVDCSLLDDACNTGFCDPGTGACTQAPLLPGTLCDDGDPCTVEDACFGGSCAGAPKDCSEASASCQRGVCEPGTGACLPEDLADGARCNTGDTCLQGQTCLAGTCQGGANQCGACETLPAGSACDDGDPCTLEDSCQLRDGVKLCVGQALDCASLDAGCLVGVCDPDTVSCTTAPAQDGLRCDDQDDCTQADACQAGACLGQPFPTCEGQPNLCEPFSPIDSLETAKALELELGAALTVRGRVDDQGESDWYAMQLERGNVLSVSTGPDCGSSLDTLVAVLHADGQTVLASNDDSEGSPWASLRQVEILHTGLYYLQVRSFASSPDSSYLMQVLHEPPPRCTQNSDCGCAFLVCGEDGRCASPLTQEAEPNATAAQATSLSLGQELLAELDGPRDLDWYRVSLEAGVPVHIKTDAFCEGATDTELRLFAADGVTELAYNDDGPSGVTAELLELTPEASGDYLVQVRGHQLATGSYRVRVEDARCSQDSDCGCADLVCDVDAGRVCTPRLAEAEPNNSLEQAQVMALGERVVGRISAPREADLYALELPRGQFTLSTSGLCGASGDTVLELLDAQGAPLGSDNDSGAGRFSRLTVEIPQAGRYYARVTWFGPGQGDYVLSSGD